MFTISTLLLLFFAFPTHSREITLSTGPIEGSELGSGYAFLGIPYAEPPVNELRFRPPQKIQAWEEVRPAQENAKSCIFASSLESTEISAEDQSEDCLYLNVFTNENCITTLGCKVVVYVHGGYHGTSRFKNDVLIENFLGEDRNVIVVTVSYRLGVLGNINLVPGGDSSAARNIALLDIIAALQWVAQEIYYFGGDPAATTLIGHDTGALNAYHLLLSPIYRNLLNQAVLMSGYDLQGELYRDRNAHSSRAFAESARCADSDTDLADFVQAEATVACLRNYSAEELVKYQLNVEAMGYYFLGNVLDDHVLPGTIDYLLGKQSGTNLMVGCSGNENELVLNVQNDTVEMEKLRFYCEIVAKERNYRYLTQATADCINEYADVSKARNVKNDVYYFRSAWNVAKSNAEAGGTSRLYEFSPRKELRKESKHDDLITYLFGYEEGELDETDVAVRASIAKTFTDFINGVDSEEWPIYPSYYLIDYNEDLELSGAQKYYKTEAIYFWNEHIERDGNYRIEREEEPWLKEIEDSVVYGGLLVADRFNRQIFTALVAIIVCACFIGFVVLLAVLNYMNKRDKPETIVFSTRNSAQLPR